jgi:hypothetical protein
VNKRLLTLIGAVTLGCGLAACGAGGGPPAGGSAGGVAATASTQEVSIGTVTGFGSVIVEGMRYDDSSAQVSVEDNPASPRTALASDLKLGMQVSVGSADGATAKTVVASAEVIGRITGLAADGFIVAAQTVRVSTDPASPTVFEGASGLADLAVNDRVVVYGQRDASNVIVATRVERKDATAGTTVRVVGPVANLSAGGTSFAVGGLTVTVASTTRVLPTGVTLANGQRVAVWSDAAVVGNTLAAKVVVASASALPGEGSARVGGLVRGLDFVARTFRIQDVDIDASTARFVNGGAVDLANGRRVRVRGSFVDSVLKATEVRFVRDQGDANVELTGAITDFVSSASFKVRGVPIDASGSGVVFGNGTAANLAEGVAVRIDGAVSGDMVKPTRVEFVTTADGAVRLFVGVVGGYDGTAGTFVLQGLNMKLTDATTFRNADGSAAQRSEFGNDDRVEVRGVFAGGVFTVSQVTFRPGVAVVVRSEGPVTQVSVSGGRFMLNGTVVSFSGTTLVQGSLDSLRNGTRVEVEGTVVGGVLVASRIEIETQDGSTVARVRGVVSDYVSIANFRVAGQKVDASGATFSGGVAADLANGRQVEARGAAVDGVLVAVQVTFR